MPPIQILYRASDGQEFDEMVRAVRYERVLQERIEQERQSAFSEWLRMQDATDEV